jgi:uncharacterized protein (DUF885 family)
MVAFWRQLPKQASRVISSARSSPLLEKIMDLSRRTLLGSAAALAAWLTFDPTSTFAAETGSALNLWFEEKFQAALKRSPQTQSTLGIKTDYDKWNDPSETKALQDFKIEKAAMKEMRRKFQWADLSAADQLSYRLYENRFARSEKAFKYRHNNYVFDQMNGAQSQLPAFLINIHRITNKLDAENYIKRLEGMEPLMQGLLKVAERRARRGVMPPKWVYPYVISDAQNIIRGKPFEDGAESTLLEDFRKKVTALALSDAEKTQLIAQAEGALVKHVGPAYRQLIALMTAQEKQATSDDGVWKFRDGADYYTERLGFHTTTNLSADQIHQIGLDNVARIHGDMKAIMKQVGFAGALQDFFKFMRTDSQFYYPNTAEGKAAYLAEATRLIDVMWQKIPQYFGILPKAQITVKQVEAFREKSAGKAFYSRPAPDGSRPGVYYANLYNMADMPKYEMEALAYHEGIPGHHLQGSITTELTDIPKFRAYGGYTAYSEGWGLYCETLPKEMGFYTDPYSDFGRLAMELWRAGRLVVDTGLHHKRWSRETAIQWLRDNTPNPDGDIVKAIERYIVYPGQATAYAIGMLEILKLRAMAKADLREKFDIRAFHDAILQSGAVPLDVLKENIHSFVEVARQRTT